MRFHIIQHQHYPGVDLHTRSIYICILDEEDDTVIHYNLRADVDKRSERVTYSGSASSLCCPATRQYESINLAG